MDYFRGLYFYDFSLIGLITFSSSSPVFCFGYKWQTNLSNGHCFSGVRYRKEYRSTL